MQAIITEQRPGINGRGCIHLKTERKPYSWGSESGEEIVHSETEQAGKHHIIRQDESLHLSSMKTDETLVGQQIRTDIFEGQLISGLIVGSNTAEVDAKKPNIIQMYSGY